jgi:hypothetical protein
MTTIGTTSRPAYVYDAQTETWIPIGVGPHSHDEYVDKVLFDNKGDILVGTGDDTIGKLAVGEDGQFLVVDLSEPTGLTWQTLNANIDVSATAPVGPTSGSVWFNSSEGTAYIFYDNYWVPLSPSVVGPQGPPGVVASDSEPTNNGVLWLDTNEDPDVPVPAGGTIGQVLTKSSSADYDTVWTNTNPTNVIINGAFDFWQRGTSGFALGGAFNADRWGFYTSVSTNKSITRQSFTPGELNIPSFGDPSFYLRFAETSATVADDNALYQPIEDVRTFAGQTVTVSFYARSSNVNSTIRPSFTQVFGIGVSSSVTVNGNFQTLTTSWARYSQTFSVPAISGKTLAANNFLQLTLSIGTSRVQNVDVWGVEVEAGSVATPFRRNANSLQGELAACQRYYEKSYPQAIAPGSNEGNVVDFYGTTDSSNNIVTRVPFAVPKRTNGYTLTTFLSNGVSGQATYVRSGASANVTSVPYRFTENAFHVYCNAGAAWVAANMNFHWTVNAEL